MPVAGHRGFRRLASLYSETLKLVYSETCTVVFRNFQSCIRQLMSLYSAACTWKLSNLYAETFAVVFRNFQSCIRQLMGLYLATCIPKLSNLYSKTFTVVFRNFQCFTRQLEKVYLETKVAFGNSTRFFGNFRGNRRMISRKRRVEKSIDVGPSLFVASAEYADVDPQF